MKKCQNCGNELSDYDSYCNACGAKYGSTQNAENSQYTVEADQPQQNCAPEYAENDCGAQQSANYYQPCSGEVDYEDGRRMRDAEKSAQSALTFGILAIAFFPLFGYTCCFPIFPLIFAIIALVKAGGYKKYFGKIDGNAKTGQTLAIVALILSGIFLFGLLIFEVMLRFVSGEITDLINNILSEIESAVNQASSTL